jgi:hypothetical protein
MAFCNFTSLIYDTECIGDSLLTINSNFKNLDGNICQLGYQFLDLDSLVRRLSAKDSQTIDMSFGGGATVAQYFLSADVKDNSLGTIKLGVDIPNSTKIFLKDPKITNCADVQVTSVGINQVLSWNGTRWVNRSLVDQAGAKNLADLEDVEFNLPLQDGQVLKYNENTKLWYNGPDAGLLRVPDGDYGDITVSNNGANWNIDPGAVGKDEIATNAVINEKIEDGAITNEKIALNTIQLDRCAFTVGEINTGINIGGGQAMYIQNDTQKRLQFRTLKGGGIITVNQVGDELEIRGANPDAPPDPTGENVGNGVGIYKNSQGNTLYFKRIRAGAGISITDNGDDITISTLPVVLGLSIIGVDANGITMDDSAIINRVTTTYPPGNFAAGTLCRVEVQVPSTANISGTVTVDVPFEIKYYKKTAADFRLIEPDAVSVGDNTFRQNRVLTVNANTGASNPAVRVTRETRTYQVAAEGFWFRRP